MNIDPGTLRADLQAVEDSIMAALHALDSARAQLDNAEAAEAADETEPVVDDDVVEPVPVDEPVAQPDVEPVPVDEPDGAA